MLTNAANTNQPNAGDLELAAFKATVENIQKKQSKASLEHLHFHFNKLSDIQPLPDETNRTDPDTATAWNLNLEWSH